MIHQPSVASNPAEQAIAARIEAAMPTLTPIHRRMGEYVLANLFRAATMRIDELASVVGASVATANRFARALGFDGYPQFREALVRGFEATLAPVERLRSAQESLAAGDDVVDASLEQAANNLHLTRTAIDSAAAEAAVEAILAAREHCLQHVLEAAIDGDEIAASDPEEVAARMTRAFIHGIGETKLLPLIGHDDDARKRQASSPSQAMIANRHEPRLLCGSIDDNQFAQHDALSGEHVD